VAQWRPLREDLPAEAVRLVRELRSYVDRCELTTTSLAAKTGYSRSSWLRYLNGRRLPPWPAAAGLGRLAQADADHLRVLWESAVHAGTRQETGGAGQPGAPHPPAPAARSTPPVSDVPAAHTLAAAAASGRPGTLTAVAAGCFLLTAVLLVLPWDSWTQDGRPDGAPQGGPAWPWELPGAADRAVAPCRSDGCRGLDPYREGCDRTSNVVHRFRAYGRTLALQYSPVCRASWAEVDDPAGTSGLRIATSGGDDRTATAGGAYTTMVGGGPEAVRAMVVIQGHQFGVGRYDSWIDVVTGSG
jgi:transcriptional regulator with XRE-family HTH domain